MSMKCLFFLLFTIIFSLRVCAQKSICEYGVLEEYQGRNKRTSIGGVDVSAKGSNPTTTDNDGLFVLEFEKGITFVQDFDFYKEGYVVFNKDAVNQWNISNNVKNRFHVVICRQQDLRKRINEYYGIYDNENKKELEKKKKEISELKITLREKEERYLQLDEEYKRLQREARTQAEKYARIDENALNEVEYKALCLFRDNKSSEALKVFDDYGLWKKAKKKCTAYSEAKKNEEEQAEDLKALIPQLMLYVDMLKLGGQRNEDSLIVKLNDLIDIYHELSDTLYNQQLSQCLYDLGKIHEPVVINYLSSLLDGGRIDKIEARHQDVNKAVECFQESALLGYAPAQYSLGKIYETSSTGIYDLFLSKEYYTQAAKQGDVLAINRLNDFVDFGQRDENGNMIYYHIKQRRGKRGTVKVTYKDISYASYKGFGDQLNGYNQFEDVMIPSHVSHGGILYDVEEIGRDAFRLSGVKKLIVPEGIDTINYFSLRSTHELQEISLPKSIRYIDNECQAWHTGLKRINIDYRNKYYYVGENGHLYSRKNNSIVLALDTLDSNSSWSEKSYYQWSVGDKFPVSVTQQDMKQRNGLKMTSFPSVNIPLDIDTIPVECFNNARLRTLTVPVSVKEILDDAFSFSNYLHDVVLPYSLKGLRTSSFKQCDRLSDIYCLSPTPPLADINTFEEGPAIRYLHVLKGKQKEYSEAQGWGVFNHIIDDIDPATSLYKVLSLRSKGKYEEAIRYATDCMNRQPSLSQLEKVQISVQKAMLCYQVGNQQEVYNAALKAISGKDYLSGVANPQLLDQLLSYNLVAVSIISENDSLSSTALSCLENTYELALSKRRLEVIETADRLTHEFIRRKNYNGDIGNRMFHDIAINSRVCMISLKADSINMETNFIKDDLTNFRNTAISLLGISLESLSTKISQFKSNPKQCSNEKELNNYLKGVILCNYVYNKINEKSKDEENRNEIDSLEVSIYKSLADIAHLSIVSGNKQLNIDKTINNIYRWCVANLSKPQVESILRDVCNFANRPLPTSFIEIPSLIHNLDNNIVPDSTDISKADSYIEYAQKLRAQEDFVNAISYYCRAAYTSSFALRLLGYMCYLGEGIPQNYDYALRLLNHAICKGDVALSSYLKGSIYDKRNDSKSAYEAYLKSDFIFSKLRLAEMYNTGEYVKPNIDKAIKIYQEILNSNDEKERKRAKKSLQTIAYKLNHMAYEEAIANNFNQAMVDISKAIDLLPDDADLLDSKGELLLWLGKTDQAVELCRKAIAIDPKVIGRSSLYQKLKRRKLL